MRNHRDRAAYMRAYRARRRALTPLEQALARVAELEAEVARLQAACVVPGRQAPAMPEPSSTAPSPRGAQAGRDAILRRMNAR